MIIRCLPLILLSLLPLTSCKKKESPEKNSNPPPVPFTSPNSFTLKKEGIPYQPNYIFVTLLDEDVIGIETYMVYQQAENNTYALQVRKSITPGFYPFEDGESTYFAIYHIQDANAVFGFSDGSLTVISNDTVAHVMHCQFEAHLFNDDMDQYPHVTDGEMTIHY